MLKRTVQLLAGEGPNSWKVVRKTDGKVLITANWKLSQDGNTLEDDFTLVQPNGPKFNVYYVYKRTAGGPGFDGTWESTSEQVKSLVELETRPYESDGLGFSIPSEGTVKNLKFDGKDYAYERPNVKAKFASSVRRVDALTLAMTDKVDGKLADTEEVKLSPDHNVLTMTIQSGVKPGRKSACLIANRELTSNRAAACTLGRQFTNIDACFARPVADVNV